MINIAQEPKEWFENKNILHIKEIKVVVRLLEENLYFIINCAK